MPSLPSGTVTFVFTDIEESTALLRKLGDAYADVLAEHRRIVRLAFGANGVEIDTQGDAFFYAFPRAREAVSAAVDVQRAHAAHEWPDEAVVSERRTWPPCAAVQMRAARTTSSPTYPSSATDGSPVCRPMRTRTGLSVGQSWAACARCTSTAAATASRARGKA